MSVPLLNIKAMLAAGPYPVSRHVQHVEQYDGDLFVVCSCMYISLPLASMPNQLQCPLEDAEIDRAKNLRRFQSLVKNRER